MLVRAAYPGSQKYGAAVWNGDIMSTFTNEYKKWFVNGNERYSMVELGHRYPILKKLVELHERMKPYTNKHMEITAETGIPIMRPMFFDYYTDKACHSLEDQYMYGEDILFVPIAHEGQTERDVYLPEGSWVNVFERKTYKSFSAFSFNPASIRA